MNDRDIEDTRMTAWETEEEFFTCALCGNDHDLTGLEVTINDNVICDTCVEYIAADFNYGRRNQRAVEQGVVADSAIACPYCKNGVEGVQDGDMLPCPKCNGSGQSQKPAEQLN